MRLLLMTACLAALPASAFAQEATTRAFGMMSSPLGDYHMARDASGTSWQPEAGEENNPMHHVMTGGWMVMRHATLYGIYDQQGGPRGDHKAFAAGMLMAGASKAFGDNTLNLRAMLSPDPLMGKRGYPLLLASGETADGVTHLVDRQHPHDLVMELSASVSHILDKDRSVFVYAGLPGEPALGPPAFMHRQAATESPEAPISHHWMDSTHITFGVVTAGYVVKDWKLEASAFRGREPDANRYDIEAPKLDSWSTRLSWAPNRKWSAQVSYGDLKSPEQLEPLDNQKRTTASLLYGSGDWSATLAWGSKTPTSGPTTQAWLAEGGWSPSDHWTLFTRAERIQQTELDPSHTLYAVAKASVGAVYDLKLTEQVKLGFGGLVSTTQIPAGLKASYGGAPTGGMAFIRLKIR